MSGRISTSWAWFFTSWSPGPFPFAGESIVEVGNAILREQPIPPSEYNPDAEAVEKIILKCLAKNPQDRYQSAAELHDALHGYLDEDDE